MAPLVCLSASAPRLLRNGFMRQPHAKALVAASTHAAAAVSMNAQRKVRVRLGGDCVSCAVHAERFIHPDLELKGVSYRRRVGELLLTRCSASSPNVVHSASEWSIE
jgi:hypothetical protein